MTPGSAVGHVSAVRHVTECALPANYFNYVPRLDKARVGSYVITGLDKQKLLIFS